MALRLFQFLALSILSCVALADTPPVAIPSANELMVIAFPGSRIGPPDASGHRTVDPGSRQFKVPMGMRETPWLASAKALSTLDTQKTPYIPEALLVVPLDGSHVALITRDQEDFDQTGGNCSYGCMSCFGVYFFTPGPKGWVVSKRVDVAAVMETLGEIRTRVEEWPLHGRVVSILSNVSYQGTSTDEVVLLALQADHLIPLLKTDIGEDEDGIRVGSTGSDDDPEEVLCLEVLKPDFDPSKGSYGPGVECHSSDGTWKFAGDRVEFEFRGDVRKVTEDGKLLPIEHWRKKAAVALQPDGSVKLVYGELPSYEH
jgi:hypothetical protein